MPVCGLKAAPRGRPDAKSVIWFPFGSDALTVKTKKAPVFTVSLPGTLNDGARLALIMRAKLNELASEPLTPVTVTLYFPAASPLIAFIVTREREGNCSGEPVETCHSYCR